MDCNPTTFLCAEFRQPLAMRWAIVYNNYRLDIEVWLSLVERCVRDAEAAGSNPVTSTIKKNPKATPHKALRCLCGLSVFQRAACVERGQMDLPKGKNPRKSIRIFVVRCCPCFKEQAG